jgi:ribosome-binding factor A
MAVERRAVRHHRERLGEALREEIETLVEGELGDPRIGLVRVTSVQLAEDGRSAHVLVDVEGDDNEAERSLEGLDAAKAYIRHEIADRLRLRRAPELFFRLDRSERERARVEELLERAKKRSKARTESSGEKV